MIYVRIVMMLVTSLAALKGSTAGAEYYAGAWLFAFATSVLIYANALALQDQVRAQ